VSASNFKVEKSEYIADRSALQQICSI